MKSQLRKEAEANRIAKAQAIDKMIADETAKAQAELDAQVKSIESKVAPDADS